MNGLDELSYGLTLPSSSCGALSRLTYKPLSPLRVGSSVTQLS